MLLSQDYGYRLIKNKDYISSRNQILEHLCKIKNFSFSDENLKKAYELNKAFKLETALDNLSESLAKEITKIYFNNKDTQQHITVKMYLSENLEYNCDIGFCFDTENNIYIQLLNYTVNDINKTCEKNNFF
jgi:hypothetical protein